MRSPAEQCTAALGQQARQLQIHGQPETQTSLLSVPQRPWKRIESSVPPCVRFGVARTVAADHVWTYFHWLYMAIIHKTAQMRSSSTAMVLPAAFMSSLWRHRASSSQQSVSWQAWKRYYSGFERKRSSKEAPRGNVAWIMGCRAALSCTCQRAQQVLNKQQLQQHILHHSWECLVGFERRCFVAQRECGASDSMQFCFFREGITVITGVGSQRPWTFQSHQQRSCEPYVQRRV